MESIWWISMSNAIILINGKHIIFLGNSLPICFTRRYDGGISVNNYNYLNARDIRNKSKRFWLIDSAVYECKWINKHAIDPRVYALHFTHIFNAFKSSNSIDMQIKTETCWKWHFQRFSPNKKQIELKFDFNYIFKLLMVSYFVLYLLLYMNHATLFHSNADETLE